LFFSRNVYFYKLGINMNRYLIRIGGISTKIEPR